MKRLGLFMVLFFVTISVPLAFVAIRTYVALDREAQAQIAFFAKQLLDEIESELTDMVRKEETRAVDEYRHTMVNQAGVVISPLAKTPNVSYVLGYLQNNPDGSFQSPLTDRSVVPSKAISLRIQQLKSVNEIFNRKKFTARIPQALKEEAQRSVGLQNEGQSAFADRYLKGSQERRSKSVLGQKEARVEEITAGQAMNFSLRETNVPPQSLWSGTTLDEVPDRGDEEKERLPPAATARPAMERQGEAIERQAAGADAGGRFQVEVAPLQAVTIDANRVFIFRRIDIGGQIYRQGFVLQVDEFLDHLLAVHYETQPIARYARLTFRVSDHFAVGDGIGLAAGKSTGRYLAGGTFPAPFDFLSAEMHIVTVPPSPARQTFTLALTVIGLILVAGFVTLYKSARAVVELSERRSQFVSNVTHELKTPLTTIRMYIEMLETGIARTKQQETQYLTILSSESTRLSGLIDNVLEMSRLEKRTHRFDYKMGDLTEVMHDVRDIMNETVTREGYDMVIRCDSLPPFAYDRNVLVQVLINLIENSIKFGRNRAEKRIVIGAQQDGRWIRLAVSDTGPGIPHRSIKHVFDDFYRVDDDLGRTTGGTGIGLALVRKFVTAMGGRVGVENNPDAGCTITIRLPVKSVEV